MTKKTTEVATTTTPSFLAVVDAGAAAPAHINTDSNRGNDKVGQEDLQIPRIKILQFISDEVKRGTESYIEGAQPGMFINTVTGELTTKLFVVNVDYSKRWNVWKTRNAGGGLIASCETEAEAIEALAVAAEAENIRPDDKERIEKTFDLIETPEHACLTINPETNATTAVIIDMPSTKQKVSRKWNSLLSTLAGDRFAHVFEVGAVLETNKRNEDYYNFTVTHLGWASEQLVKDAESLWEGIQNSRK